MFMDGPRDMEEAKGVSIDAGVVTTFEPSL
jgi:hypothetical protein